MTASNQKCGMVSCTREPSDRTRESKRRESSIPTKSTSCEVRKLPGFYKRMRILCTIKSFACACVACVHTHGVEFCFLPSLVFNFWLFLAGASRFRNFANSPHPIMYSQLCKSGLCIPYFTPDAP